MARASLGLFAVVMSTSACLVTSMPQHEEPTQTPPQLIFATADPDPRRVVVVDSADLKIKNTLHFAADVMSQDDPGSTVEFRLYLDYGVPGPDPFRVVIDRAAPLDPGVITDTGRRGVEPWTPDSTPQILPGCHTATLMASHEFDRATACPKDPDDYSLITWQILRCDSSKPDEAPCDQMVLDECLTWTRTCASAAAEADGGLP